MNPFHKKPIRHEDPETTLRRFSLARLKHKLRPQHKLLKKTILGALVVGTIIIFVFSIYLLQILRDLPDIEDTRSLIFPESTVLLDSSGTVELYSVHGDENRKIVPIDQMSTHVIRAILAAEDDGFYSHPGFDLGGIAMAFCHEFVGSLGGLCPQRGGSTITQQLVKNFFLTNERTISRKLRELILAYRMESRYNKDEILEIYLNGISFGSNLYGVETASQAFFRKSASELSVAEAAILASLVQRPTYYSPHGEQAFSHVLISEERIAEENFETFQSIDELPGLTWVPGLVGREIELANGKTDYFPGRADGYVLGRMRDLQYISTAEYEQARSDLLSIEFPEFRINLTAPHFVIWVREQLEERFGADLMEHGGLRVITSLDMELQEQAEAAIAAHIQKNTEQYEASNAALVAIETKTGLIRALVGSADYWNEAIDGNVNIILKKRLPGSSFKPITYAAAFAAGKLSPARILFDVQTNFGNGWVPQNFDGQFRGPVSVRRALGNSLNIPAVKAAIIAGPTAVYDLATKMGISFDFDADFYGAAIALGGAEATPLDMAKAFAVFANNGKKLEPVAILRVEDRFGNLLYEAEDQSQLDEEELQVLDAGIAYQITHILSDPAARGPGWNSRLQLAGRQNLVKTGTADKKVDNTPWPADVWTVGATPQLTTAVWAGNSDGTVLARRASGFDVAAPIWQDFMTTAHTDLPAEQFEVPRGVSRIQVSKLSGLLPADHTSASLITEDIVSGINAPGETDSALQLITIDSVSGKLPTENTPESAKKEVAVLAMHSYFPEWAHWETPVQEWLAENKAEMLQSFGINAEDILSEAPTDFDDVHSRETAREKPTLRFISPDDGAQVSPPRTAIELDIDAPNGFEKVIFYWDDRLIKSFDALEEAFVIPVSPNETGKHTLTAKVTDRLKYSIEQSITVEIARDRDDPEVSIVSPGSRENISGGSEVTIRVSATDRSGAVRKVDFYVDDEHLGGVPVELGEFEKGWSVPNRGGEYRLRAVATDYAGNTGETTLTVQVDERPESSVFGILSPADGSTESCERGARVTAGVTGATRRDFERLEIWGNRGTQTKVRIAEFTELSDTGFFEANFSPDICGEWRLNAKVFLENGSPRVSSSVFVEFE